MLLISLDINQARQTARAFDRSSDDLENLRTHLRQQWSALSASWEGLSHDSVEPDMQALLNHCRQAAESVRERGVKLTQIADRFQAADENVASAVAAMVWASTVMSGTLPYVNRTQPTAASISGVIDERPPVVEWLGDNTPLAFIPGFTPPAGGDLITIDDRLQMKFGRDVNLVDGNEIWTDYEVAAIDRATSNLPDSLVGLSLLRNIYRDKSDGGSALAFWLPPGHPCEGDTQHEPSSITFMSPMSFIGTRQGGSDVGSRVETVIFHELVHSAQYDSDGQMNELTKAYLKQFEWSEDAKTYYGNDQAFPGSGDKILNLIDGPVGYPKESRTGREDMAEAVTYYRYEPQTLLNDSPERYQWVKDHIFNGQEFK